MNGFHKHKKLIGRIDRADFPRLDLKNIPIKIDTGAYTSSIHCANIVEDNGLLTCLFLSSPGVDYPYKEFVFKNYEQVMVKSSNGISQKRYAIHSTIVLFGVAYPIHLTLNDRSDMKNPVLIGRKFLNGKFIVDSQLKYLSFNLSELCRHEY